MAQPQPQAPLRTLSPTKQMSPSQIPHAAAFPGQPPSKKPRLSPALSPQGLAQPNPMFSSFGPNNGVGNASSPATPGTPNSIASPIPFPVSALQSAAPNYPLPTSTVPSATASPIPMPSALPPSAAATSYNIAHANGNGNGNGSLSGNTTPKLQPPTMPTPALQTFSPKPAQTPTPPTPTGPLTPSGPPLPHLAPVPSPAPTATNVFVPMATPPAAQAPTGVMGPPLKPADRPAKEYQYDVDDSLAGTGIDLRQEEQFQADYFAGAYRPGARTGFPANAPGPRSSFYGSLSANQPAQTIDEVNQNKALVEEAKVKWAESARNLATARGNALHNRFLEFNALHARVDKVAREYGIGVILDPKTAPSTSSVRLRQDVDFPKPEVKVKTAVGPDGVAYVATTATFLPEDTFLADQLALLSLATKHRLRELLEDANKVAVMRQRTSHGVVPEEWVDVAAPLPSTGSASLPKDDNGTAGDSGTNPLKRPFQADDTMSTAEAIKKISAANTLAQSLRIVGRNERTIEEQRLLKRQKREGLKTDQAPATPSGGRAGTPGTPGSAAPDTDKAPTKKELKKNAAAKVAEQNDTLSANRTSMAFLGGRKKQYSWMSGGSGASTPKRSFSAGGGGAGSGGGGGGSGGAAGGGGGPGGSGGAGAGGTPGRGPSEPAMLTAEGRTKWGSWREDGIKGKDVQLRDWVVVLEADGRDTVALQSAYDRLDGMPPPKSAT